MDIALSDKQVLRIVKGKANIVLYPNLYRYQNIDDLITPYGACFILFESKPSFGHWCALIKTGDNDIEFFNPYGGYPDDSLGYIPEQFAKISNQDYPYLSRLMIDSKYNLAYNEHTFQKRNRDIRTCGRWSAMRILLKDYSLDEFTKYFLNKNSDKLVTTLTSWINE